MIYFDVTRLLEWRGNYTGMERVAYELALNMTRSDDTTRLVYFVESIGFVDITDDIMWGDGCITSNLSHRGGIREMAKIHPLRAARAYVKRSRQDKHLMKRPYIQSGGGNTLFISDGLWDRRSYIDAIIGAADDGMKIAHLVHDMVPLAVPHVCHDFVTEAIRTYFTAITPHIDVVVSISKNTEKDFFKYFGNIARKTIKRAIVRHGEDFAVTKGQKPAIAQGLKEFILCVGTLEIRKNHLLLYQAYKLANQQGIDLPPLIIVGREGWLTEQTMKLIRDDPELRNKILIAGPVSDAELVWLYKHCSYTTLAALYEGWGLQVAESLYYGKICAVSDAGPLPEVGGDLNVYFSPYNSQECLSALQQLNDVTVRERLEKRVRSEYRPTTWHDAAQTIISAL